MAVMNFEKVASQVDMLSYIDRVKLLDKLVKTLTTNKEKKSHTSVLKANNIDIAFGLWREKDISLEMIRKKAWRNYIEK